MIHITNMLQHLHTFKIQTIYYVYAIHVHQKKDNDVNKITWRECS